MNGSPTGHFWRDAPGDLKIGAIICGLFALCALSSVVWTPYDTGSLDIAGRFQSPSPAHILGTDHLGRDVLSMLMQGAQISIFVAFLSISIAVLIGGALGLIAAAYGDPVDAAIMRLNDVAFAFPAVILAILISAAFGPGASVVIVAIAVFNIPVFARITRAAALPLWKKGYVLHAQTAGKSRLHISLEHILPNLAYLLIAQGAIQFSLAILAEAGLSYIGLGVQPPQPSWGRMLAESQTFMATAPWLAIFPGAAIFLFVYGANKIGEGFRRRLDPHERVVS